MILFIFEGKKAEPRLYKTLKELFHLEIHEEEILHYYCSNIFSLYNTIKSYGFFDGSIDLINIFKTELPDENFKDYTFDLLSKKSFKQIVHDESFYQNLKYLCFDLNKSGEICDIDDEKRIKTIQQNWFHLNELNIKKAHLICAENYSLPSNKELINQKTLFNKQIEKYVNPKHQVAILNAFPLFYFEYFDENKIRKI